MTKQLSPAAQSVLDAFFAGDWQDEPLHSNLAAALRAAITAVGSEEIFHPTSKRTDGVKWCVQRIYAIANELEAQ
jgi:hypothetical protein